MPLQPKTRPSSLLVQIRNRNRKALNLIFLATRIACLRGDADADPGCRGARFSKLVLDDADRFRFTVDVDGDALVAAAIDNAVILDAVPMRGERLAAAAKFDAGLA